MRSFNAYRIDADGERNVDSRIQDRAGWRQNGPWPMFQWGRQGIVTLSQAVLPCSSFIFIRSSRLRTKALIPGVDNRVIPLYFLHSLLLPFPLYNAWVALAGAAHALAPAPSCSQVARCQGHNALFLPPVSLALPPRCPHTAKILAPPMVGLQRKCNSILPVGWHLSSFPDLL